MSLSTNITNLATRVATEIKAVRTLVNNNAGDLSALTTTAKNNLVAAINELDAAIDSVDLTALIDDNATATTTTWSSTKIDSSIDAAVAALVDGAPELLDTLNELAAALGDDENFATNIAQAIADAETDAVTAANAYTDAEILILEGAIGDTTADYVATFEAGLV
jgi:hypothetical protein